MARFFGIAPGGERSAPGICVRVSEDGERAYMSGRQCGFVGGKWFDLADSHAVMWVDGGMTPRFRRPDGRELFLGSFPAWVVRGTGKRPAIVAMFSFGQFEGGKISVKRSGG